MWMQIRIYLLEIVSFISTLGELKWFERFVHMTKGGFICSQSHNLHALEGRWVRHSFQCTSSTFSFFLFFFKLISISHGFHFIYVCLSWWPSIRSSIFHLHSPFNVPFLFIFHCWKTRWTIAHLPPLTLLLWDRTVVTSPLLMLKRLFFSSGHIYTWTGRSHHFDRSP